MLHGWPVKENIRSEGRPCFPHGSHYAEAEVAPPAGSFSDADTDPEAAPLAGALAPSEPPDANALAASFASAISLTGDVGDPSAYENEI